MSNIDISRIEKVLEVVTEAEATGAIMTSLTWSYAMSLLATEAALRRVHNPDDPRYGRLTDQQREEVQANLEARHATCLDLIQWFYPQTSEEIRPEPEAIIARFMDTGDERKPDHDDIKELALLFDRTIKQVQASVERNAKRDFAERQVQIQAVQESADTLTKVLARAFTGQSTPVEIPTRDAIRILDKIAEKCDEYAERRLDRGERTRRTRKRQELAAEARLLEAAVEAADELGGRLQKELDASDGRHIGQAAAEGQVA